MPKKTPGQIIATKREEGFSLNRLEEITGMNRSSILRYQRGEARIPSDVIQKLAAAFFQDEEQQEAFVELCQLHNGMSKASIAAEKKRRDELRRVKKTFKAEVNIMEISTHGVEDPEPLLNNKVDSKGRTYSQGLNYELDHKYHYREAAASVSIFDKSASIFDDKIITMYPEGFCFYTYGFVEDKDFPDAGKIHSTTPWAQEDALQKYVEFCRERKLGRFALLDLARKEVEESEKFNTGFFKKWNEERQELYVMADSETLGRIEQSLQSGKKSKTLNEARNRIDMALAHIRYLNSRAHEVPKFKETLLSQIDNWLNQLS